MPGQKILFLKPYILVVLDVLPKASKQNRQDESSVPENSLAAMNCMSFISGLVANSASPNDLPVSLVLQPPEPPHV